MMDLFMICKYINSIYNIDYFKFWIDWIKCSSMYLIYDDWNKVLILTNEPFRLVVKTFPFQSKEKFGIVWLDQTEKNTYNMANLWINTFDIYANIYTN